MINIETSNIFFYNSSDLINFSFVIIYKKKEFFVFLIFIKINIKLILIKTLSIKQISSFILFNYFLEPLMLF